jgi:hypothetical protein
MYSRCGFHDCDYRGDFQVDTKQRKQNSRSFRVSWLVTIEGGALVRAEFGFNKGLNGGFALGRSGDDGVQCGCRHVEILPRL